MAIKISHLNHGKSAVIAALTQLAKEFPELIGVDLAKEDHDKTGWIIIDDIGPNIVDKIFKSMLPEIPQESTPQLKYHERFNTGKVPKPRR